jgi:5-methylcytosine-specific restriction protein A
MAAWPYNTSRWQKLRAAKLARDPLCDDCLRTGMVVAADTVDHRLAISQGGHPFPALGELSSKCAPCHSRKTARGAEAGAARTDKPMKGCTSDGLPIDPLHPWA